MNLEAEILNIASTLFDVYDIDENGDVFTYKSEKLNEIIRECLRRDLDSWGEKTLSHDGRTGD